MTKKALISRLETLQGDYRKRSREYSREAVFQRKTSHPFEANRYEGVAMASRWVAEDLEELLDSVRG